VLRAFHFAATACTCSLANEQRIESHCQSSSQGVRIWCRKSISQRLSFCIASRHRFRHQHAAASLKKESGLSFGSARVQCAALVGIHARRALLHGATTLGRLQHLITLATWEKSTCRSIAQEADPFVLCVAECSTVGVRGKADYGSASISSLQPTFAQNTSTDHTGPTSASWHKIGSESNRAICREASRWRDIRPLAGEDPRRGYGSRTTGRSRSRPTRQCE
jgi:hypothetical protein